MPESYSQGDPFHLPPKFVPPAGSGIKSLDEVVELDKDGSD
jgi:hypothetical protein